jgi:hypothetical protein
MRAAGIFFKFGLRVHLLPAEDLERCSRRVYMRLYQRIAESQCIIPLASVGYASH